MSHKKKKTVKASIPYNVAKYQKFKKKKSELFEDAYLYYFYYDSVSFTDKKIYIRRYFQTK